MATNEQKIKCPKCGELILIKNSNRWSKLSSNIINGVKLVNQKYYVGL